MEIINYGKPNNESYKSKIENIQCKPCIAIIGVIQGASHECFYQELGLKSLENRRWYHEIVNGATPRHLTRYLNTKHNLVYDKRASDQNNIRKFRARTEYFNQSFSPFFVNARHKQDSSMRKAKSTKRLKSMFKEFFNLKQRSLFAIHDPVGVKLLSRLRLKFSHLNEHKFRHNFKDAASPM